MHFSKVSKFALTTAAIGCLALSLASSPAVAATSTTTFTVSATVQAACQISAAPMAFGVYSGAAATTTSTVSVTCTNTTPYNVGLSAGQSTGATVANRKMAGPGSTFLSYALFSDSARTVNWGTTAGTDTVAGTGNGAIQAVNIYGRVTAGQFVAPGSYSDTITAEVIY